MKNLKFRKLKYLSCHISNLFFLICTPYFFIFKRKFIDNSNKDEAKNQKGLIIYATFGEVKDYKIEAIKQYRKDGFSVAVVINQDNKEVNYKPYNNLADFIILRENVGRDFGAYRAAILSLPLNNYHNIILTNDSVYGPWKSIKSQFELWQNSGKPLWGLTDSFDQCHHIQSYFIGLKNDVAKSRKFKKYWKNYLRTNSRSYVIFKGEFELSKILFKISSYEVFISAPYRELKEKYLKDIGSNFSGKRAMRRTITNNINEEVDLYHFNVNPTHFFWKELITDYDIPYQKIDLVKYNREGIEGVIDLSKNNLNKKI